MLVGATNSGKTVVFEILKHAMCTIKKNVYYFINFNINRDPKIINFN